MSGACCPKAPCNFISNFSLTWLNCLGKLLQFLNLNGLGILGRISLTMTTVLGWTPAFPRKNWAGCSCVFLQGGHQKNWGEKTCGGRHVWRFTSKMGTKNRPEKTLLKTGEFVLQKIPSRELTYPTLGKGKSSSKCHFLGRCLEKSTKHLLPNGSLMVMLPW